MSAIPWSATREYKLRRSILFWWAMVWLAFALCLLNVIAAFTLYRIGFAIPAGCFFISGMAAIYSLGVRRAELGEEMRRLPNGQFYEGSGMLANKPRSTANLTRWIEWATEYGPAVVRTCRLSCECGRVHEGSAWQWIPNYDPAVEGEIESFAPGSRSFQIDPGGGRWVILCPCGLGHYKLKA